MDWSDEGIFLSAKPLGEANAIAELLTLGHGRHLGLVRGGRSRRIRPLLQPGNLIRVTWRARLSEHLGGFNVELMEAHAARVLDDAAALAALSARSRGLRGCCPSATRIPRCLRRRSTCCAHSTMPGYGPHFSCAGNCSYLGELGFGLDLSECAATGADADLAYVSPRSGRAVSRDAGQPYCNKLLKLPAFLLDDAAPASEADIVAGLALTGHFLERDVLAPHGLAMPQARERLISLLGRPPKAARSA